jgi:hypothetical protein
MTALNAALAFAVASYAKSSEEAPITRVVEQKLVKTQKNKKPVVKAAPVVQATPVTSTPIGTMPVPEKGSLEARGFIVMMRNAKDRNEKILAIAAYCGYDFSGTFGDQEMKAMSQAKRELRPIDTSGPSLAEERSAKRSALGYVSGMPNGLKVKLQNLLGREKMTVDTMLSHVKAARSAATKEEKTHHAGLAALEKGRLNEIQAEIRSIVGR